MRPDVPLRLDAALRRAMAKDPADRFGSMDEFVAELEACLAALGRPDADHTVIMPPARPPARAGRPVRRRRRIAPLVVLVLGLAAIGGATAAYLTLRHHGGSGGGTSGPITLKAVSAYDPPPGDGREHDAEVPNATDGKPDTFWETESYRSVTFGNLKDGVGIVLDAGRAVRPDAIVVESDTPGFQAKIEASQSSQSGFADVSSVQTVGSSTTFNLSMSAPEQYFLVWITRLAPGYPRTHVNEVTAR